MSPLSPQSIRPRARILRTFGDELISSEDVAIIELVKNAYDADATHVLIRFVDSLKVGQGSIEIIDNGHGMSIETVSGTWMEPATLFRKRSTKSERMGRRVLGEKGIGRFASSRLADNLTLITRRAGDTQEIHAIFDWTQFDLEDKFLDEINILIEPRNPREICRGGTIEKLWERPQGLQESELNHGTILRMEKIRKSWTQESITSLQIRLARLISPFLEGSNAENESGFEIRLEVPAPLESMSGIVESPEMLRDPHYRLIGNVDRHGRYDFTIKLKGVNGEHHKDGTLYKDKKDKEVTPKCGPFAVELRVWDRDRLSLNELVTKYGKTLANVRDDLDAVAGINIYRDGFRVFPYGEPGNDWLRLDLRRVQNPTMRLSNNQIAGYILISADENSELRDQSNREGIIETPAFHDLQYLVTATLAILEQERYLLPERRSTSARIRRGLFSDFDLNAIRDFAKQRYPNDLELQTLVKEKQADLGQRITEVQEVLSRYLRLATLGQLIDTVLHEGRHPLAKIKNEIDLAVRDVERIDADFSKLHRLKERIVSLKNYADALATVFRKIEPFGGRKRGKPVTVRLEQVIRDAFSILDAEIERLDVSIELPETNTLLTVEPSEIQQIIINLLQNSLYWLEDVPTISRKITVKTRPLMNEEVEILFSDNGPGVAEEIRDRIFDPYFSTKIDGVGLGLAVAGEIISDYYGGRLELLDNGPLNGATFRITLRRRV